MKSKVATLEEIIPLFKSGQTILFGDWHGELSAEEIISALLETDINDIHAVAVSGGMIDQGLGRLIHKKKVSTLATTHIGLNPEVKDQMNSKDIEVEFIPQGTFAERIRCGGAGLGGCLTPTGVGTDVEKGKEKITINGKEYLLELPIRGDIALIKAEKADEYGNIKFRLTGRACNKYMAFAADTVICEVEDLVEAGELDPDEIDVPAPVIDYIYVRQGEKKPLCPMWQRAKAKAEGGGK